MRAWAGLAGGFFLLSALAWPQLLAPMNRAWTALGNGLHRIVSPVALALVFFGAVLPTGLLLRLRGRDPLRLRLEPGTRSYWIRRDPPGPEPESLKNQF